jgi:DNA-binding NarL/FixJ family response regulator
MPGLRVLIVDDTTAVRGLLRTWMDLSSNEVVGEAADGLEGVAMAKELQPDWVILDWEMPRLEGIDALPKILEAAPGARVVMYSSHAGAGARQAARAAGATAYLEKSASLHDMQVVLEG